MNQTGTKGYQLAVFGTPIVPVKESLRPLSVSLDLR